MDSQDLGIMIGFGVLAIIGLLYTFTDIRIPSLIHTPTPATEERSRIGENTPNTPEEKRDAEERKAEEAPPPIQREVEIARVREGRNMTTLQEEAAHDRDSDFDGDEESEYVILEASSDNTVPVNVTGWRLENRFGTAHATVGQSRVTIAPGRTDLRDIILDPGDEVYVMSGEPPDRWFSARLNICHGYFDHFFEDELTVSIPNQCPDVPFDALPTDLQDDEFCRESFENQRTCEPVEDVLSLASHECFDALDELFTYRSCVERNIQRDDFQTSEWRYYLDADDPLWDVRDDGLLLYNAEGDLIDHEGID